MHSITVNPFSLRAVQEKIRLTNIERYGGPSPTASREVISKIMRTRRHAVMLKHWKSNAELVCVGTYEFAFVNWCNINRIDFEWQIPHKMPDGRTYIIDAMIKTGDHAGMWIEIKGYMSSISRQKWDWFHAEHMNDSQLWNKERLQELRILSL